MTAASPYPGQGRISRAEQAAAEHGVDEFVGMDWQMRKAVQDIVKVPVVLASSLLGRLAAELVTADGCQRESGA